MAPMASMAHGLDRFNGLEGLHCLWLRPLWPLASLASTAYGLYSLRPWLLRPLRPLWPTALRPCGLWRVWYLPICQLLFLVGVGLIVGPSRVSSIFFRRDRLTACICFFGGTIFFFDQPFSFGGAFCF